MARKPDFKAGNFGLGGERTKSAVIRLKMFQLRRNETYFGF